jgi:endonuclease/exonuclease/phosphatase family metal-dependent hydrolase
MRRILGLVAALVLVGLVGLTVARFVHTEVRWLILLASFSPYAVIGAVVLLLGCLIALRGVRRRAWMAVAAAVALVCLVVQAWSQLPLFVGGAQGKPDLTVMTSNLEYGQGDAATVVRAVAERNVDVLVLEEVTPASLPLLLAAGLGELLPNRLGVPARSASGTLVFSRYPLGASRPLKLGNVGLDVEVSAPLPFRLLAVHTAQPINRPSPWFTDMGTLRGRVGETVRRGPAIAMGDFNATLDHQPFREVLGAGMHDAAEQAGSGWQPSWPTRYRESWLRPLITIDHVLTSGEYAAIRTESVEVPGTDHLAVVAELRVRKGD